MLFDSHCHLTDSRLRAQLEAVVLRARAAGVERMVTIGTDVDDSRAAIKLCAGRDYLRCSVGIQPNGVDEQSLSRVPELRPLLTDPAVAAIGEIGLDYHYHFARHDLQRPVFEAQLAMAGEADRPVVIHCREAVDDTLSILRNARMSSAVFHCFTGTLDEARRILDAGYLISLAGVLTFKKSDELREVARLVPADRLLLETDAPYLSPEPVRKQHPNEPSLIVHTAAEVARLRSIDVQELSQITARNAARFFHWA